MTRIGIFGGCFDPVHLGHLIMAEQLRERSGVHCVVFVPTLDPPHRPAVASYEDRLALVQLAIEGHAGFSVSDVERDLPRPSFTLRTLDALAELGEPVLFLGADALAGLPTWHEPAEVLRRAEIAVARRPGTPDPLEALRPHFPGQLDRVVVHDTPAIGISSTEIRRRLAAGSSVRFLVPAGTEARLAEVAAYR